jgi:L-methionine (R)-S-oxide reductase
MDLLEALKTQDLDHALRTVLAHFKCEIGTIHRIEPDGKLHLRAHTEGIPAPILEASRVIPLGKGIAGRAAQNGKATNMTSLQADSDPRIPIATKADDTIGAVCVPILDGDKVVGTIGIAVKGERAFSPGEEALLTNAGRVIAQNLG